MDGHDLLVAATTGGILLLLQLLIKIKPLEIDLKNVGARLGKRISRAINGEVLSKVEGLEKDVTALKASAEEQKAVNCRVRILRFGDEILHNMEHSKEHFDQTLRDIDYYERYCREHDGFENSVAVAAIERIRKVYQKKLDANDFL